MVELGTLENGDVFTFNDGEGVLMVTSYKESGMWLCVHLNTGKASFYDPKDQVFKVSSAGNYWRAS